MNFTWHGGCSVAGKVMLSLRISQQPLDALSKQFLTTGLQTRARAAVFTVLQNWSA